MIGMRDVARVCAVAALFLGGSAAGRADKAVVVGVEKYPKVREAENLKGCRNDALAMKAMLERLGYEVTLLLDADATRQKILDTLSAVGAAIRPEERFVFYFAGHGTGGRSPGLMPSDVTRSTKEEAERSLLHKDTLRAAVNAIDASERLILLDACFSGAMSRRLPPVGASRPVPRRDRYFPLDEGRSPVVDDEMPANGADVEPAVEKDAQKAQNEKKAPVIYFTAAQQNQKSWEWDYPSNGSPGGPHGIFTANILRFLQANKKPITWSDIHSEVGGEVFNESLESQQPLLAPTVVQKQVAVTLLPKPQADTYRPEGGGGGAPPPPPPPTESLLQTFNRSHPNPEALSVRIQPDRSGFKVGESFVLSVLCRVKGYLVLVEKNQKNQLIRVFPSSGRVDDCQVESSENDVFSDVAEGEEPGIEYVKAFLFTDREAARAFLAALENKPLVSDSRDIAWGRKGKSFLTSQVTFQFYTEEKPVNTAPDKKAERSGPAAAGFALGSSFRTAP